MTSLPSTAETASVCAVPGCGVTIRLVNGRWLDESPRDPALCPGARDLTHRPEGTSR